MLDQEFTTATLHILREAVLAHANAGGMPEARATDVMLAVHELAANAVSHGGGTGRVRLRIAAGKLDCQVTDPGNAHASTHLPATPACQGSGPAAQPWPCQPGHGLWLVREAADQITVTTGPRGSQVTVSFIAHPTVACNADASVRLTNSAPFMRGSPLPVFPFAGLVPELRHA